MKRSFRAVATIAGLIERNTPSARKSGRQATFSSDILFDTLPKYDPDHLMMQITRTGALRGLVDFGRIENMRARLRARLGAGLSLVRRDRVTPRAAPLFLERGKVPVAAFSR